MTVLPQITDNNQILGEYFATDRPSYKPIMKGSLFLSEKRLIEGGSGHYGYPRFPDFRDVGGSFCLETRTVTHIPWSGTIRASGPYRTDSYKGKLIGSLSLPVWYGDGTNKPYTPNLWGTQAYAAMKPTKPTNNLFASIVELKDIFGMLRQRLLSGGWYNFVGSSYLAYQFGWGPLLQDIVNTIFLQKKIEKQVKQLLRDNGKPVRRSWKAHGLDPIVTESTFSNEYFHINPASGFVGYFFRTPERGRIVQTTSDDVWASARFRYWLPEGPNGVHYPRSIQAALNGLYVSPSQIYRAIPWTWLIDWFGSITAALSNFESGVADRLAADYFYVMRHRQTVTEKFATGGFWNMAQQPIDVSVSSFSTVDVKSRVHGDPFGLDTPYNTLSVSRLAILGALGLSRLG